MDITITLIEGEAVIKYPEDIVPSFEVKKLVWH